MTNESFYSLISTMVVLFLMLATGFVARKAGIIDDIASKRLSKLIVCVGQPMMIINALIKMEYSSAKAQEGLIILAVGMALHIFMSICAFFGAKAVKNIDEKKITEFSIIFANAGFIGFPILKSIFGDTGEFWGSFYVVAFNIFVWTWGMVILSRGRDDIRMTPRKVLLNYGTIPCAIGLILYFLTQWIEIPEFVVSYTGFLSNLCTPISVLIVGALIAKQTPKQIFADPKIYYVCFFRLILIPVVVCLIEKALGLPSYIILFSAAVSAMPCATNITMFAELYEIAPGYASLTVGVSSLFTVITLPLVMLFANLIA